MLDDITAVKSWSKVNDGMKKMYDAEVLGKLPVMQHALFGSLLPFPKPEDDPELRQALEDDTVIEPDSHGHIHAEKGWAMDCCGIPGEYHCSINFEALRELTASVPSAFAQAQAEGIAQQSATPALPQRSGIRPIPFD